MSSSHLAILLLLTAAAGQVVGLACITKKPDAGLTFAGWCVVGLVIATLSLGVSLISAQVKEKQHSQVGDSDWKELLSQRIRFVDSTYYLAQPLPVDEFRPFSTSIYMNIYTDPMFPKVRMYFKWRNTAEPRGPQIDTIIEKNSNGNTEVCGGFASTREHVDRAESITYAYSGLGGRFQWEGTLLSERAAKLGDLPGINRFGIELPAETSIDDVEGWELNLWMSSGRILNVVIEPSRFHLGRPTVFNESLNASVRGDELLSAIEMEFRSQEDTKAKFSTHIN